RSSASLLRIRPPRLLRMAGVRWPVATGRGFTGESRAALPGEEAHHLCADVLHRGDDRLAAPEDGSWEPGLPPAGEDEPAAPDIQRDLQPVHEGLRLQPAVVGPVPQLLASPPAREPRGEHL